MEFRKKGVFGSGQGTNLIPTLALCVSQDGIFAAAPRAVFQRGDQVRIDEPAFTVGNRAVFPPSTQR